ncbi:helix-hairpin-helix domain-containing protein [uncultured Eubacterium sp.]|uniref:helix-hairpin-helix domain-containing protein n=1 Tax=uncultured Eubacterium sp. TaxID=165185 RepID=UPI0025E57815|nr:helix-hairpin-helix domain-containing protein [uncultured Eubacterium sp.]
MKRWIRIWMGVLLLLSVLPGCGTKPEEILLAAESSVQQEAAPSLKKDSSQELSVTELQEDLVQADTIFVYVCGAVCNPGVYELPADSRAYEAVAQAGGMSENAAGTVVNLAEVLTDGQKLQIPFQGEVSELQGSDNGEITTDSRVNINTASVEELMTLKGIGQTRAEQILEYREKYGSFANPEAIMNVDGIKQGTYDKIKDNIRVQ